MADSRLRSSIFNENGSIEVNRILFPFTATVSTLLYLILKGKMEGQTINEGDTILLCSVGAGMNINSIVYKL